MTKVYVVLEELDDPWYGSGNIKMIFDTKEKANEWIKDDKDKPIFLRELHIEEFDIM
jgi:hypothetical protein